MELLSKYLTSSIAPEYQNQVKKQYSQHIYNRQLLIQAFILLSQIIMVFSISTRPGGPFLKPRRTAYFSLYILLILITLLILGIKILYRKNIEKNFNIFFKLEYGYMFFLCLWSTAVTLNDQLGGNGLNVFIYMTLIIAVFSVFPIWKIIILFTGNFFLLNILLPYFPVPSGANHTFNNFMNSLFITIFAIVMAVTFYYSQMREEYNKIIIQEQLQEIYEINSQLHKEVLTDNLTGVYNRKYLEDIMKNQFERNQKLQENIICMMIDIDYFKKYNDTYGHQEGDNCLIAITKFLKEKAESNNAHIIRYGGEEFLLFLFQKSCQEGMEFAKELQMEIEKNSFRESYHLKGNITISIGIYWEHQRKNSTIEQYIKFADEALYEAKEKGRNCVVLSKKK